MTSPPRTRTTWIDKGLLRKTPARQSEERDQDTPKEGKEAMENENANGACKQGIWTPWAQILCPEHIGWENIPSAPSNEEWQEWVTPAALKEGNAVTFCDSCGDVVQLNQSEAVEHTLVYELRAAGFDAFMAQTGGMNSACMVNIADETKTGDEIEGPAQMYICYDLFGAGSSTSRSSPRRASSRMSTGVR